MRRTAGWDRALLALELQELWVDLNFDVTIIGFETAEVDLLILTLIQVLPGRGTAPATHAGHAV
ncbi:MAG: hypothetical protein ACREDL_12825 [Bradyrhizobium sp.]